MCHDSITIALPSLVRRVGGDNVKELKNVAAESDCTLNRIRRSRNWQISGKHEDLQQYLEALLTEDQEKTALVIEYIRTALKANKKTVEVSTEELIYKRLCSNPNCTLNELMSEFDCSIVEARKARFAYDEHVE